MPQARRRSRRNGSEERRSATVWEDPRVSSPTEQQLVERRDRGVIRHASTVYGTSLDGLPLTVFLPQAGVAEILILAAIHGDELETTVAVSEALRCLPEG